MLDTNTNPTPTSPAYQTTDDIYGTLPGTTASDQISTEVSLDDLIIEENEQAFADEFGAVVPTPQNEGEQATSGHMPNPESDDDMLESSHQMGMRLDEDDENPQPLNLAREIEKAEQAHRHGS